MVFISELCLGHNSVILLNFIEISGLEIFNLNSFVNRIPIIHKRK